MSRISSTPAERLATAASSVLYWCCMLRCGHPDTPANVYVPPGRNERWCRKCIAARARKRRADPGLAEKHRRWASTSYKRASAALWQKVLDRYGRSCHCCGEDCEAFLVLDHVNNDGAEHRRLVRPGKPAAGVHTYRWLARNGWPEGYQTLCSNCNLAKARFGVCPHEVAL